MNLVEWPTVAVGTFDEEFLAVPREMLENAMTSHQRYFPVERADGTLDNRFIVAHNGDPERTEQIVRGHERVIRARLADAAFFYQRGPRDCRSRSWLPKLESVVFQERLGTAAAEVARVERLRPSSPPWSMPLPTRPPSRPARRISPRPTSSPTRSSSSPTCRASWVATTR